MPVRTQTRNAPLTKKARPRTKQLFRENLLQKDRVALHNMERRYKRGEWPYPPSEIRKLQGDTANRGISEIGVKKSKRNLKRIRDFVVKNERY